MRNARKAVKRLRHETRYCYDLSMCIPGNLTDMLAARLEVLLILEAPIMKLRSADILLCCMHIGSC